MLSEFRSTNITWDKATRRIYSPISANESDENGRKLVVQVVNSGQVEDLTGATLHLYWETKDKAHDGLDVFKAVDLKKGEFELSYTTGMLSNKGVLNANLVLIDTVGRVVSERFKITVKEGIDNDSVQSEDSFTALTEALIQINKYQSDIDGIKQDLVDESNQLIRTEKAELDALQLDYAERAETLEETYAPRLTEVTSQLQQTNERVMDISKTDTSLSIIKQNIPLITFVDDDGHREILTKLVPLSQKHNVPFVVAMPSDFMLNPENGLSSNELKELQDEHGFEIASHGKSHIVLDENAPSSNAKDEEELVSEIYGSWKTMREHGLKIDTMVYPSGQSSNLARAIVSKYYKAGVATDARNNGANGAPILTYNMGRMAFPKADGTGTLDYYKGLVDTAITQKSWLIFMLHCGQTVHDAAQQQHLDDLIAYIKQKNVKIATVSEGVDIVGNVIDINEQQLYVSKDGTNNIANYIPLAKNTVTGASQLSLAMLPSEFSPNKTYRSAIGDQLNLSPSGTRGTLEVVMGDIYQESYRRYIDSGAGEFISWGQSDDKWGKWLTTIQTDGLQSKTVSGTVPAGGIFTSYVFLGGNTNKRITIATARTLPPNLLFTYIDNGLDGHLNIRIFNPTASPITIKDLIVDYYTTTFR